MKTLIFNSLLLGIRTGSDRMYKSVHFRTSDRLNGLNQLSVNKIKMTHLAQTGQTF